MDRCLFSYQISPKGRAGNFHMLCCQGFEVKTNYDVTLGRLAYESLRLVHDFATYQEKEPYCACS